MRPEFDHHPGAVRRVYRCLPTAAVLCLVFIFCETVSAGASPVVEQVRHWSAPDHTRVVLDLSGPGSYEIRRVGDPERVAINVDGGSFRSLEAIVVGDGLVKRIRRNGLRTRAQVVLDLQVRAELRHFSLPAADGRPHRIVLDIMRSAGAKPAPVVAKPAPIVAKPAPPSSPPASSPDVFTVVLDPGHGGMDPGASRKGAREKDIVLAVAREAARLLDELPGYRAVLTRDRDYFLSLARRVEIAQQKEGDIFISIHCNTHRKRSIAGMEVYFLSLKGATDREARELADKENAADLVGLAPEERRDDSVLSILMDLRMTRVLDHSSRLAERILGAAQRSGVVGSRKIKQARFQVLRSLAMPSTLVELAYLSNDGDRQLMRSREGAAELAAILVRGILSYRGDQLALASVKPGTSWTERCKVRRGDTLWELARRYRTTVAAIREKNDLRSAKIWIGQMLKLPPAE